MTVQPAPEKRFPSRWIRHARDAWHGRVPLARLCFVDMLIWGTIVNLTTSGVSLALLAAGAPIPVVILVWAACWPFNAFLCLCVWRTAAVRPGPLSGFAGPLATLWALGVSAV